MNVPAYQPTMMESQLVDDAASVVMGELAHAVVYRRQGRQPGAFTTAVLIPARTAVGSTPAVGSAKVPGAIGGSRVYSLMVLAAAAGATDRGHGTDADAAMVSGRVLYLQAGDQFDVPGPMVGRMGEASVAVTVTSRTITHTPGLWQAEVTL